MLSEEQLEIISEALRPLFQYLEHEAIVDLARRIQKTLTYTRTAELQAISMREMGFSPARIRKEAMKILRADAEYRKAVAKNTLEYKRQIRKNIQETVNRAYKAGNEIVANAGNMSWIDDLSVWKQAGKKLSDKSFLHQLVKSFSDQTAGELKNLTQTTGFKTMSGRVSIENAYRNELDKAVIKICSGVFGSEKVMRDVVHNLAQSGLRSIDFASGYSMQLDTAATVALRTGCHQLAGKISDKNIEKTGENLVYVSRHAGARNTGEGHGNHEQWQGKVYFIREGHDYSAEARRIGQDRIMDLWYATGYSADGSRENDPAGLYGYGCRHNHHPWFEGASVLPRDQPDPEPVTINGKTYDYYAMTQKMRSMERAVRALKREKEALNKLGMDTKEISTKIKRKTAEYRDFCEKCGIRAKANRLRYECGTADLKKTEAWKEYHKAEFESELKSKALGVSDAAGDGGQPILIGQIDISKKEDAVKYFGEMIRNSDVEQLYIIDKNGCVYYNKGTEDRVSVGTLDLSDSIVLHNHPKASGIVSFGSDDFILMRDYPNAVYVLVNEEYNYTVKVINNLDDITYNQAWRGSMEIIHELMGEEHQHIIMEYLRRKGYIEYVRKKIKR